MSRRRNTWMMGVAAGVLTLGMMTGCSRVPETIPEIDTSPPFYEPSGEDQTEPEGSYTTGGLTEESTEERKTTEAGRKDTEEATEQTETPARTESTEETPGSASQTEAGSEALTDQDTEAYLTESAEAETAESPELEESTEGTKESEAIWPTTAPPRPSMPESTESKAETTTRPVTEAETTEALEAEETEPTETEPTEGETERLAETEPETEEVTEPVTQPTSESVTKPNRESEGSTERETEAEIVLQAIQIKANQSQYAQGWKLTKANLTVTLCYSDGTSGTLTNGYSIHQTDDQVYVTYSGIKSNTITVVYEKTLTSISIESKADGYEQGYQIIGANLNVTLHYSDNSAETLAHGYTIDG